MARPGQVGLALVVLLALTAVARAQDARVAAHEAHHGEPTTVQVPGDAALEVLLGPPSVSQVIVYMHGVCGDPFAFRSWARAARRRATFISLRGDETCEKRPSRRRWSWDLPRLDRRIRDAIAAVGHFRGRPLDADDVALVGYSQGAHRVEHLAFRFPERYRRVLMIAPANEPNAGRLAKAERVVLMAGGWDAKTHILKGFRDLERRQRAAKYLELPKARHGQYGPEAPRVMDEALGWLLDRETAEKQESSVGGVSNSAGPD
ncbi:MAG TPA: hypothetical protein ENK57_22215 [Polyangiaceae bacterium]|nr:hypothetical protein [Polyangiaceae bacterium]